MSRHFCNLLNLNNIPAVICIFEEGPKLRVERWVSEHEARRFALFPFPFSNFRLFRISTFNYLLLTHVNRIIDTFPAKYRFSWVNGRNHASNGAGSNARVAVASHGFQVPALDPAAAQTRDAFARFGLNQDFQRAMTKKNRWEGKK